MSKVVKIIEADLSSDIEKTIKCLKLGENNVENWGWVYRELINTADGDKNVYIQILTVNLTSYGAVFISIVKLSGRSEIVRKKLSMEEFKEKLMIEVRPPQIIAPKEPALRYVIALCKKRIRQRAS